MRAAERLGADLGQIVAGTLLAGTRAKVRIMGPQHRHGLVHLHALQDRAVVAEQRKGGRVHPLQTVHRLEFVGDLGVQARVQTQAADGQPVLLTAQRQRADVDVVLAEDAGHRAEEARLVLVLEEEQLSLGRQLQVEVVHLHDTRLVALQHGADQLAFAVLRLEGDGETGAVHRGSVLVHLDHLEAELAGQQRRVDVVHALLDQLRENALEGGRLEQRGAVLELVAASAQLHALQTALDQLRLQRADALGQLDVGVQLLARRQLGENARVHHADHLAALERVHELVCDVHGHLALRLVGVCAQMRRADEVRVREQRLGALLGRLALVDVQRGGSHTAAVQRLEQVVLVDDATASTVHDAHALLALGKGLLVQQMARVRVERRVQRDEVRLREQLLQLHRHDTGLFGECARQQRIVAEHRHVERLARLGHTTTDRTQTHDTDGLAVQLGAHELLSVPATLLQ
mmetsp:Transcript_5703/g.17489  ORF Transcript_5703/g.17489 Transcript_5703/m.17489 type:complete len:461 (+) Transcript_5703:1059-2441(+)